MQESTKVILAIILMVLICISVDYLLIITDRKINKRRIINKYGKEIDIELTYLLENKFNNYHFEEEITDNDILFDYNLRERRAKSRNAIKLLSLIGYNNDIINNANDRAERFVTTGKWE